ncbi:hypothetical protein CWI39_0361p0010 [Hamiltosporidium magnivora]|uniref:Exocyst complex component Sec3 coiled-coil domain-containing protein n=1 Tax=Hamiltosporidium magnivora TaxID=148818 RepID=A0A4Q9LGL2_9MICR|nr:hypothetical protein CWI39_0361p0010 [Hamiltosporidium magnivora]
MQNTNEEDIMLEDNNLLENLDKFIEETSNLKSHINSLNLIQEHCNSLASSLNLHIVKMSALSQEMENVQEKNKNLDLEIRNTTLLYDELKKLLIVLEIKDEHFEALHSLNTPISKIERALDIFTSVSLENYTLDLALEKKELIQTQLKSFFKKFSTFFATILASPTPTGELIIHTDLYKTITPYKEILKYFKKYENYTLISSVYTTFSKDTYNHELSYQLKIITKVINHDMDIKEAFDILFQSIFLVYRAENFFVKRVILPEEDCLEMLEFIFRDFNNALVNGIKKIYKNAPVTCLNALKSVIEKYRPKNSEKIFKNKNNFEIQDKESLNKSEKEEINESYKIIFGKLILEVESFYEELKQDFIQKERSQYEYEGRKKGLIRTINILKKSEIEEINSSLLSNVIESLSNYPPKKYSDIVNKRILCYQILNSTESNSFLIDSDKIRLNEFEDKVKDEFEKETIGYVFKDEEYEKRIKNIIKEIGELKIVKNEFKKICFENSDNENEIENIFKTKEY